MSLLFLLIEHQPMHNLLSVNGLMIVMHQRCIAPTCQVFIENLTQSFVTMKLFYSIYPSITTY